MTPIHSSIKINRGLYKKQVNNKSHGLLTSELRIVGLSLSKLSLLNDGCVLWLLSIHKSQGEYF